jgi:hypothetical protein
VSSCYHICVFNIAIYVLKRALIYLNLSSVEEAEREAYQGSIKALSRLYQASIKALLRLYKGSIKAL